MRLFDKMLNKSTSSEVHHVEEVLKDIWKELLGLENPKIDDNFFHHGGTSIKALRLCASINSRLLKRVEISSIYKYPKFHNLVIYVSTLEQFVNDIVPASTSEGYQVTDIEKKEVILSKIRNESKFFNLLFFDRHPQFNKKILNKCIRSLVNRHEALRTNYYIANNNVYKRIKKVHDIDFNIHCLDFENCYLQEQKINQFIDNEHKIVFDLENGPLFRITIIRIGHGFDLLVFTIHHIISDAWSMEILRKELYDLYLLNKSKFFFSNLPDKKVQYKEYSSWYNEQMRSPSGERSRLYYQNLFKNPIPKLDISGKSSRLLGSRSYRLELAKEIELFKGTIDSSMSNHLYGLVSTISRHNGKGFRTTIDIRVANALKSLALCANTSISIVLSAASFVFFYKLTGVNDLCFDIPIISRERTEFTNVVGWLMDGMLIRHQVKNTISFEDLLNEVTENILNTSSFRYYSVEKLINELDIPLEEIIKIQLNFVSLDAYLHQDILSHESTHFNFSIPYYDIALIFKEFRNGIELICQYRSDLYDGIFIERITRQYIRLLNEVSSSPKSIIRTFLENEK